MHTPSISWLTGLILWWLCGAPAHAITLAEAVQTAMRQHPNHALTQAQHKVESGYRQQAEALFAGDPSIRLSAISDGPGSHFGYEEYVAGLSIPVWWPGQRAAKAAIADSLGELADAEFLRFSWTVAGVVLERAWALRITESEAEQSARQVDAARALLQDIHRRYIAGERSRNDLLLAQQDLVSAKITHQQALDAQARAQLAWHNYTGLQTLPEDLEDFPADMELGVLDQHPGIRAASHAVQVAATMAEDAQARQRAAPELSLIARKDRGSRQERYTESVGVEFSLPLGTRAPSAPAIAEAEAELTRAETQARLLRRSLRLRLAQAEQTLKQADKLLALAEQQHDHSQARLKLAQRAFELGEMDLYHLLLAQRQYYEDSRELALRRLEKSRARAIRTHLSGIMPQ